ncbi:hypothetical protein HAX54_005415, partial [Datura stramonium]|nr:hypothetical protein [Datura stramonium]
SGKNGFKPLPRPCVASVLSDCDRQITNESSVEISLPSVLLTIGGSSTVHGSPPA